MRLATFNILHGRSLTDGLVDVDRFAAAVRTLDADVLGLQEVDRDQERSHGADLAAVAAEAMGAVEHRFLATMAGPPGRWAAATPNAHPAPGRYGIALLSRHPVRLWRTIALPTLHGRVPVVFRGSRRLVWVRDEPRAAVVAVIDAPEGELTVVATHLTLIPGLNTIQLRHIVRCVRDLPRPLVVLGDLNLDGDRPAHAAHMRPLASALTMPLAAPVRQIDHILGVGPVRTMSAATGIDLGVSDHRALAVEVEIGTPPSLTPGRARR